MQNVIAKFGQRLAQKSRATKSDLALYRPTSRGRSVIVVDDRFVPLDIEGDIDNLDAVERSVAERDNPYWDFTNNRAELEGATPDHVDHRPNQTPIKHQLDRGTCVCFASLACLESISYVATKNGLELSEQYANWLYMRKEARNQCDDGTRTTLSARYLYEEGVCEEKYWPYEELDTVRGHCTQQPSQAASSNARYGIKTHTIIDRLGLLGPSIANPDYLETVLQNGHDIVFGTNVAWGRPNADGVHDVILDSFGNPLTSRGGHAMLIVGYDRRESIPYFMLKNSWGVAHGQQGYLYLSYDYIRQYAKYGYIVHEMRSDMV